jgi:para-nitrobenzyl esterase
MSAAWIAFARTGSPNGPGLPEWPAYDLKNRATMVFDVPSAAGNDPLGRQQALIAQYA